MPLSPMMQQYLEIKKQHPDKIIFFRLGDFYEMFFDDAKTASAELELALTGRDCGQEEKAPMCGVPYHAYESYLAKLIQKGYKVAICEQMESPSQTKGIVKREVVRVVTPGTVIENSMLQDDKNNYIASIYATENETAICLADISTGTAYLTCIEKKDMQMHIVSELSCYLPREVILNEYALGIKQVTDYIKFKLSCGVEVIENNVFKTDNCNEIVNAHFGENNEITKKLSCDSVLQKAVCGLLYYLNQTQKKGVERLKNISLYKQTQYMSLPDTTRTNLELCQTMRAREKKGTLLWVLDKTQTAMGKRLLRTWIDRPLLSTKAINARLQAVNELYKDFITRQEIKNTLSGIFDMERLITRIYHGSAMPNEVLALANTCNKIPKILSLTTSFACPHIQLLHTRIDPLTDIADKILNLIEDPAPATLKDGKVIKRGANSEADEYFNIMTNGREYLSELEAKLKEETGIKTLKVGYNRVFGYYIEVSKLMSAQVPEHFVRKQTIANSERYITEELKVLENKILGASERLLAIERRLYDELLCEISADILRVQTTSDALAQLDVLCSFAHVAASNNYVMPEVDDGDKTVIEEGRHPVIEQMLNNTLFVPNNTNLDCDENRMAIITGPNMAGKSTYMRQTALIVLMAQIGSFVPAKMCKTGIVDAIYTRVGASDDLSLGQSTFMVEMSEVSEILKSATKNSLVILDEIGRGPSTFDGMSIARAVVEHIADKNANLGCKTLFATHYHELTELENSIDGVKNYNIAAKKRGDDITFLRRIVRGAADDSYGIEVSKLAGLPDSVIKRAKEVLEILEESAPNLSETAQLSFDTVKKQSRSIYTQTLAEKIENLDVETLTPIEALNKLYELKKIANNLKNDQ